jgi:hypothetical protein
VAPKPVGYWKSVSEKIALLIVCLALPIAAHAQGESVDEETELSMFVLGNVEFLILHELAHMLIGEKEIPIIGSEENAADYIAATFLIRASGLDSDEQALLRQFLVSAADAFSISWDIGTEYGADIPYWDSHGLSIQRFYGIVCLLYGSDPEEYGDLVVKAKLPEAR